jgi:hypothetical protein
MVKFSVIVAAKKLHYTNESGHLVSSLLKMLYLNNGAHTGENIARAIDNLLNDWGLRNKCIAVVSDTAASQLKANNHDYYFDYRLFHKNCID